MAMVAIEATIVSTVMPKIVTQLGGLHLYSWVFSSFLLTQTAMTVVFGKLAELYGRKPAMLVGIVVFLVGSVLARFARSMSAMITFRLIPISCDSFLARHQATLSSTLRRDLRSTSPSISRSLPS